MAPSRSGRRRRRRRAVRTDRTGAGCSGSHAARRLRAPPAGSARLRGSPIPRRRRRPGARLGSAQAGPEARLRAAAAWSRPRGSCGTRRGAGHGVGRRGSRRRGASGGRGGSAQPPRSEGRGPEQRGTRSKDGARRPCPPATEGAPAARPRRALPPQAGSLGRSRQRQGSAG